MIKHIIPKVFRYLWLSLVHSLTLWHYCKSCTLPCSNLICKDCLNSFEQIPDPNCQNCKKPLREQQLKCYDCQINPPYFDDFYCSMSYANPVKNMLHAIKYKSKTKYAQALGYLLYQNLHRLPQLADMILIAPLHKKRYKQRGFNQVNLLLDYYRMLNNSIPICADGLIRVKDTAHQTLVDKTTRQTHISDAFELTIAVNNLHVLIIDDVYTTGATLNELAKMCKQNGAKQVDICCLMRTL